MCSNGSFGAAPRYIQLVCHNRPVRTSAAWMGMGISMKTAVSRGAPATSSALINTSATLHRVREQGADLRTGVACAQDAVVPGPHHEAFRAPAAPPCEV